MSDQPPTADAPNPLDPEVLANQAIDRVIDGIAISATAYARVVSLGAEDVPRLCAAAACRQLEQQMEGYHRRKTAAAAGVTTFDKPQRDSAQIVIQLAAESLIEAFESGLTMARQLHRAIGTPDVTLQ
jgi:hypothetical protein